LAYTSIPIVARSATKHGVSDGDIVHAYCNPIRIWDLGEGFMMIIGAGLTGELLEVGYVEADRAPVVVHAMPARTKFLW